MEWGTALLSLIFYKVGGEGASINFCVLKVCISFKLDSIKIQGFKKFGIFEQGFFKLTSCIDPVYDILSLNSSLSL